MARIPFVGELPPAMGSGTYLSSGCPKCHTGSLQAKRDNAGAYIACLQCGYHHDLPDDTLLRCEPTIMRPALGITGASVTFGHTAPKRAHG